MKLKDLLRDIGERKLVNFINTEVAGVAYDSRKVRDGYLFVAIAGSVLDGHNFIKDAVDRGARAVLVEKRDVLVPPDVSVVVVDDARQMLGRVASTFYGEPSKNLKLIGVTGTNGKTTTTYLMRAVLEEAGGRCGLVGTISYEIGERVISSVNTTPETLDLQQLMAEMVEARCTHAVMEVSSHGIEQGRIASLHFDAGIFTNIASHEHLDYHKRFKNYLKAKVRFFEQYLAESEKTKRVGIVNADERHAGHFIKALKRKGIPVLTYGQTKRAAVRMTGYETRRDGNVLEVEIGGARERFSMRLRGLGNLYNALACIAYASWEGVPLNAVKAGLAKVDVVPGRFEFVREGQSFDVIVDYAHTEHALRNLLTSIRTLRPGRTILVFGCGGDRDRSKRSLMGSVAVRMADIVIVTSDNPRSENPFDIIADIERGISFRFRRKYVVIEDRRKAIQEAVALARPEDCVAIAGKGHETYQILKNTVVPFDDREEARKAIRALGEDRREAG